MNGKHGCPIPSASLTKLWKPRPISLHREISWLCLITRGGQAVGAYPQASDFIRVDRVDRFWTILFHWNPILVGISSFVLQKNIFFSFHRMFRRVWLKPHTCFCCLNQLVHPQDLLLEAAFFQVKSPVCCWWNPQFSWRPQGDPGISRGCSPHSLADLGPVAKL